MQSSSLVVRRELLESVQDLTERGLYYAAKWSAEQALGLGPSSEDEVVTTNVAHNEDYVKYHLAKSHFDLKEYYRVADLLRDSTNHKGLFLCAYSLFLAGEKRKEEEIAAGKLNAVNPELKGLQGQFQALHAAARLDGFGLYLYGIVLRELRMTGWARSVLADAVNAYPCNWSAWLDLASVCVDFESVRVLKLSDHWMRDFFMAHMLLELQQNFEAIKIYHQLRSLFPQSIYILAQTAVCNYNMREYDTGEIIFEQLQKRDPRRLENMDVYSNILYVKEAKAKLSSLAHMAAETDKYCPETCCIIGNYYSLKSEHEKAVTYFKRALRLNRKYLSAWTLMGHEYVELKNTSAAIEAYRKAVEINPRDYRAWYGLGNTYQILKMPLYAMYYFRKATAIRPYDARMWSSLGVCYEQLDRNEDAIKCYERTEACRDTEVSFAFNKLGKLYHEMGDDDKAAYYHKKNLDKRDREQSDGNDTIEALLFLANHCKNIGNYKDAEKYASRLLDYSGKEKEEAKALLREIQRINQQ